MEYLICPIAKPRMTRSDRWKKRNCVVKYFGYKDRLKELNINLPIPAKVTFFLPMPPSWKRQKCEDMNGKPHKQTPDVDNLLKGLLDALYEDDSAVWSVWPEKRWAEEQKANDRIRDKYLEKQGIRVVRFTGSEISKNAGDCVEIIHNQVLDRFRTPQ